MPSSALSSEMARLRSLPPPSPGKSGRPGSATPSQRMPAKVAVVARPADSSADRALEAAARSLCRRLFSIVRNPRGACQASAGTANPGFPRPRERWWEDRRNVPSDLARLGPEVDLALGRVAVDLVELVV